MGGISFYKSKDGYIARKKGGVDGSRIKNDAAFERTRENGLEFGRAGLGARLIRSATRNLAIRTADARMSSRLTRELMKIIQADTVNVRGGRKIGALALPLLNGFEFNEGGKLVNTFMGAFAHTVDRQAGIVSVTVSPFVPANVILKPESATHFKLLSAAIELDFDTGQYVTAVASIEPGQIGMEEIPEIEVMHELTAASTRPWLVVFGVEFYQEVNGNMYPLNNGAFNALAVTAVDGGA